MAIQVVPLGAGQDVGRSCVLVTIGGRNIMFDCGMHMGYNDEKKFPDFSYISKCGQFDIKLDCVIITHFHLDHCGALPYFSEVCGYNGPIYMTHPTKAICPILLEDYRKISSERKGELIFTEKDLKNCMKKCIGVSLYETVLIDEDFEFRPYYAGHVLGAAMFYVKSGDESVVYTGDYNMTPDRHLGAAWIDEVRPDLLITETTYATYIRESKRTRERDFLKKVHDCVLSGGKVIIPVFALGRAQELCILIETYWERSDLKVPVYFSAGLTEKANRFYQLFINWTNQKIKETFVKRNMFEFNHIKPWEMNFVDNEGPMVLFSTPGMLHIGTSLEVFKKWAPNPKNMVILPGYCVKGTVGAKVLAGMKDIKVDNYTRINVQLQVANLSFSAHADSKGIKQLIHMCKPRNVLLVHGEGLKMNVLKSEIMMEFGIPCYDPPNGVTVNISTGNFTNINISDFLIKNTYLNYKNCIETLGENNKRLCGSLGLDNFSEVPINGLLIMDKSSKIPKLIHHSELPSYVDSQPSKMISQKLSFFLTKTVNLGKFLEENPEHEGYMDKNSFFLDFLASALCAYSSALQEIKKAGNFTLSIKSINVTMAEESLELHWFYEDENLANKILSVINVILQ